MRAAVFFGLWMAPPALLFIASMTAQAAEPQTLTLACQGTITDTKQDDAKPEPISMGIIVNFAARTVAGFTEPPFGTKHPVTISAVTEVTVAFSGPSNDSNWGIIGAIDRVTGDVWASSTVYNPKTHELVGGTNYSLKCRTAQRMF